ncbi:biotin/lipoyl-binding protein [Patescibacteria group bacterium]|nr:biotin/lipoyl-binding protein [Patescibacteria group bacterium]
MRKHIHKALSKPKSFLPIFGVIVIVLTIFTFMRIGRLPVVPESIQNTNNNGVAISGDNVSLSFAKTGRLAEVLVKTGDSVKAGTTLARLSATDAEGLVTQAKGALDLARAQYAALKSQYATTKAQQDIIVKNAYRTLLSAGLEGVPDRQDPNTPIISGTYTCDKEGSYILKPYSSADGDTGFSMNFSGLESGFAPVKFDNAVPLGNCGLQIKFNNNSNFRALTVWTINIPNTKSSVYLQNKNAYDLAVTNRDKILSDLANNISSSDTSEQGVAKAQVDAAEGAYQAALGAYQNNLIVAPIDGVVTFVDSNLKVGQSVTSGKAVISISQK